MHTPEELGRRTAELFQLLTEGMPDSPTVAAEERIKAGTEFKKGVEEFLKDAKFKDNNLKFMSSGVGHVYLPMSLALLILSSQLGVSNVPIDACYGKLALLIGESSRELNKLPTKFILMEMEESIKDLAERTKKAQNIEKALSKSGSANNKPRIIH